MKAHEYKNKSNFFLGHLANSATSQFNFLNLVLIYCLRHASGCVGEVKIIIDDSTPPEEAAAYRESIGKATGLFLRFAQDAILFWVQQNNLQYKN